VDALWQNIEHIAGSHVTIVANKQNIGWIFSLSRPRPSLAVFLWNCGSEGADRHFVDSNASSSNGPISDVWMQFSLPVELSICRWPPGPGSASRRICWRPIMAAAPALMMLIISPSSAWWRPATSDDDVTPLPEAHRMITWSIDSALDTWRNAPRNDREDDRSDRVHYTAAVYTALSDRPCTQ